MLIARPANAHKPVWVMLGKANTMKLSAARKKAWEELHQMQRGINPNAEKKKLQVETFGALAEKYIEEVVRQKRQGKQVARYLRSDWLGQVPIRTRLQPSGRWVTEWRDGKDPIFWNKPAALITREDILHRLNTIRRTRGPYAARHALSAVQRVFSFAFDHGLSGVKFSPAASLPRSQRGPEWRHDDSTETTYP